MTRKDTNLLALKVGLTIFLVFVMPLADTAWWVNILMGMMQGVGVYTVLDKLFERFHTDVYHEKYK